MIPVLKPGKRVIVSEFGESPTEAIEHFISLEDVAAPDPATLKADEVIIEIRSAAVAWVDLLMTSGQYQHMAMPPYCPGMEYSGVVTWAGAAVDPCHVAPGDRVFSDWFTAGPRAGGRYQAAGGFATHAVLPANAVRRIRVRCALFDCRLDLDAERGARSRPAWRPQRQPVAQQHHADEGPLRTRLPGRHLGGAGSVDPPAARGAGDAMGRRRSHPAAHFAPVCTGRFQAGDAGALER